MEKKLNELLLDGVREVSAVAPNALLGARYQSLANVMRFIGQTPQAAYAEHRLRRIFANRNWSLDPQALEAFFQLVGELQFWMLADDRGVRLDRVPETDRPMPDFRVRSSLADSPRFEVKTLSVTNGWRGLADMAEGSFDAQLELQHQVASGRRIAIAAHSVAPHGQVPRELQQTTMCRHLIDKAAGNIKLGQYDGAPTFLVLNLMLIDGHFNGSSDLRPAAPGYPEDWSVRTGALWTLAFGSVGQLVHGVPEFEGMPGVEGRLEREGVLADSQFSEVAGLLLVVHRLSEEPTVYGLLRSVDVRQWESERTAVGTVFFDLVGENWNDELDSNGWQLTKH